MAVGELVTVPVALTLGLAVAAGVGVAAAVTTIVILSILSPWFSACATLSPETTLPMIGKLVPLIAVELSPVQMKNCEPFAIATVPSA